MMNGCASRRWPMARCTSLFTSPLSEADSFFRSRALQPKKNINRIAVKPTFPLLCDVRLRVSHQASIYFVSDFLPNFSIWQGICWVQLEWMLKHIPTNILLPCQLIQIVMYLWQNMLPFQCGIREFWQRKDIKRLTPSLFGRIIHQHRIALIPSSFRARE